MAVSIKHAYQSATPDDPTHEISSGEWNADLVTSMATARFLGRTTAGAGTFEELTGTQATALLDNFTSTLKGLVPLSGGGIVNYLRADGAWGKIDVTVSISGIVPIANGGTGTSTGISAATQTALDGKVAKAGDTMTGALHISDTTVSTSPTTGALTVAGGLGLGGALFASGNLSIGKATPALVLSGSEANGKQVSVYENAGVFSIDYAANFNLAQWDMTTGKMTVTTGPLAVSNSTASTSPTTGAVTIAGGLGVGGNVYGGIISGGTALQVDNGTATSPPVVFNAAGFSQWRIDNGSGLLRFYDGPARFVLTAGTGNANVTSSTASTSPTTGALTVAGGLGVGGDFYVGGASYLGAGFRSKAGMSGAYGGDVHNFNWVSPNIQVWVDATNLGNMTVSCDYRMKKDIRLLPSTWNAVKALRPICYTQAAFTPAGATQPLFVDDDIERWGFLAHELQETLLPTAANGYKDIPNEVQSPNWLAIVAALTKTLQEAQERIEALEITVAQLQAR